MEERCIYDCCLKRTILDSEAGFEDLNGYYENKSSKDIKRQILYKHKKIIIFEFQPTFMQKTFLLLLFLLAVSVLAQLDKSIAYEMVQLSEASYSSKSELQAWTCPFCLPTLKDPYYISNTAKQLQGFVAYSTTQKKVVVVFRGTAFLKNWIKNFRADLVGYKYENCSNCKVHHGFKSLSEVLFQDVVKFVKLLREKYGNIEVTLGGHSLGGALAILVGAHLKRNLGVILNIYTFGAPRVGNRAFAQYCSSIFKQNYRVVNYNDAVVHLPPKDLGYRHSDTEFWFNTKTRQLESCVGDSSKQCSNSVKLMNLKSSSHYCRKYVQLLKQTQFQSAAPPQKTATNLRSSAPIQDNDDGKQESKLKYSSAEGSDDGKERKYRSSLTGVDGYQVYTFLRQFQSEKEIGEYAN